MADPWDGMGWIIGYAERGFRKISGLRGEVMGAGPGRGQVHGDELYYMQTT